ncbi:hypothetical protein, partial [Escherichia coli]|uniref:hypothetical protein n=1 Tax=Escherichia coli TaxID=562 RepID=UPI001BDBDA85
VAEQEGQLIETEATGAPQKHHHTLNQEVGSITRFVVFFLIFLGFKFLSMNKKSIKPLLNMILMVKKSKQPVN